MLRELVSKVDDDGESLIHISHCLGFPYSLSILNKLLLKTLKKHSMLFAKLWRNINAFCNRNQLCWYDESALASSAPSNESVPSSSRKKKSKWSFPWSCNTKNTIVSARKGMINLKILHAFNTVGIIDSDLGLKYVY